MISFARALNLYSTTTTSFEKENEKIRRSTKGHIIGLTVVCASDSVFADIGCVYKFTYLLTYLLTKIGLLYRFLTVTQQVDRDDQVDV